MSWNAWGDPALAKPLSAGIAALLEQALGVTGATVDAVTVEDVRLRPSTLSPTDRAALAGIVGAANIADDDRSRLLRAGGKSTPDLLRRKSSDPQDAPDAVVAPGTEDEVAAVLRLCAQQRIAVVPFGGGTSVVGGLDPDRGRFGAGRRGPVCALGSGRLDL